MLLSCICPLEGEANKDCFTQIDSLRAEVKLRFDESHVTDIALYISFHSFNTYLLCLTTCQKLF